MKKFKIVLLFIYFLFLNLSTKGQDSLTVNVLDSLTYSFSIEDGKLLGTGADFLKKEMANAQFTLLGDYPDSKQLAILTNALIPELTNLGYKTMALNTGPISSQIIQKSSSSPTHFIKDSKALNHQYLFKNNQQKQVPIPAIKHVEDAQFIKEAFENKWSIIGLGKESWNSYQMLFEQLFSNLTPAQKNSHKTIYQNTLDSLNHYLKERDDKLLRFSNTLQTSKTINHFLDISSVQPNNLAIIAAFKYSLNYVRMTGLKQYYPKNKLRIIEEKRLLKAGIESLNLNINHDKIFVKMDLDYIAKGASSSTQYGFGNLLHEVSNYQEKKSLHIGCFRRFYQEDGILKDELNLDYYLSNWYKDLIQMGKKEEWIIIDIRPLVEGTYYYPLKYKMNQQMKDLILRYDLILIPKTDLSPTPNYD